MPRRANSFARALKDAEKRLARAQAEQNKAEHRLHELSVEIPQLRQIIASLGGKEPAAPVFTHKPIPGVINEAMATLPDGSDLRSLVGPQDLSGMGSIPSQHPPSPMKIETEDDTLGEPEGEELSE